MTPSPERMPGVLWAYLFWGLLIGAPLAAVMLFGTLRFERQIGVVAALPSEGGPAVFEGALARPAGLHTTPLGAPVAGWSGVVLSAVKSGKTTTRTVACARAELDGLTLEGAPLWLRANGGPALDGASDLVTALNARGPAGVQGDVVRSEAIPEAVAADCGLAPPRDHETRTWVEHRFAPGAHVTFIGCRSPEGLAPCAAPLPADGLVFVGTRRALVDRLLATTLLSGAGLVLIAIFFSLVAAVVTLRRLRAEGRA